MSKSCGHPDCPCDDLAPLVEALSESAEQSEKAKT